MALKIHNPGVMTTVQDLGRFGHQSFGFSPAGVMDYQNAILANQLVGNSAGEAVLEFSLQGASFEVLADTVIASAGAPIDLKVNGKNYPVGRVIYLGKGDFVAFGTAEKGMRTYLAVPGGFSVSEELDSRSTHVRSGIGGLNGRVLQSGDYLFAEGNDANSFPWTVREQEEESSGTIRLIPGPEFGYFTEEAKETLTKQPYTIQKDSDRMGIRLSGEVLETETGEHDILSEPTQLGNVQVPKNGLPIILLNDRQTAGGYKRIATVIKADLPKLVQKRPGEEIQFELIDLEKATALYKEKMTALLSKELLEADYHHEFYRRTAAEKINKLLMR